MGAGPEQIPPICSAVVGLSRRTPPVVGVIITARRLSVARQLWLFRGLFLFRFADAGAAKQKDLGVFDEAIGNGGRDRRVEQDVSPFGER